MASLLNIYILSSAPINLFFMEKNTVPKRPLGLLLISNSFKFSVHLFFNSVGESIGQCIALYSEPIILYCAHRFHSHIKKAIRKQFCKNSLGL